MNLLDDCGIHHRLARAEHPATSHQAAAEIAPSLGLRQTVALEAVRRSPGRTGAELEDLNTPADDQGEAFTITNAPPVAEWEAQARALAHAIGESALSCAARFEEGQHDSLMAETDARLMESLTRSLIGVLRKLRPMDEAEMVEECLARR